MAGMKRLLGRLFGRRSGLPDLAGLPPTPPEEIPLLVNRLTTLKSEMDRSLYDLRRWSRDLALRLGRREDEGDRTRSLATLGDTVGGLAHNFNNSLGAILGYTELLLREAQDDTTRRRLAIVRQVALEAGATVRQLQEFLAREPQVAFGPVALLPVVSEALALTEPRWRDDAEREGATITVTRQFGAAPPVDGNFVELRDLFVRLILDAVAAMPCGGALAIRAWDEESGWVVIEVADTGAGDRELGAMAGIVERHGGSIGVSRDDRGGTSVRVRLLASPYQVIPAATAPAPLPAERARRILLVDDDRRLLRALADLLQGHGHAVLSAASGAEALALFDPVAVDLVVTDLGMPGLTGWEVAALVKSRAPHVPVFLLTGWGETVAADERSRYVDRVIAKPVSADALLAPLAEIARSDAGSAAC